MKGQTDKINYKLKDIKKPNINASTQMIIAEKIYVLCSKYQKDIIQIPYKYRSFATTNTCRYNCDV